MTVRWGTQDLPLVGGVAPVGLFATGVRATVPGLEAAGRGTEVPFACTIQLNGTRDLMFLPAAQETAVALTFLLARSELLGRSEPEHREARSFGLWRALARDRRSQALSLTLDRQRSAAEQLAPMARLATFGVSLVQTVDVYQQSERAVKYAVLFIILTFLVFFLWEVFQATLLHPMHVRVCRLRAVRVLPPAGSISERAGFDVAYGISASVTTLLIAGYARAIFSGTRQGLTVLAALIGLYGFLYLLLRLEDYALLAGSIGVFLVLAWVMYITRRMNWYDLRLGGSN